MLLHSVYQEHMKEWNEILEYQVSCSLEPSMCLPNFGHKRSYDSLNIVLLILTSISLIHKSLNFDLII